MLAAVERLALENAAILRHDQLTSFTITSAPARRVRRPSTSSSAGSPLRMPVFNAALCTVNEQIDRQFGTPVTLEDASSYAAFSWCSDWRSENHASRDAAD